MTQLDPHARRALGRTLSRLATASVRESLAHGQEVSATRPPASRLGFTGAPGAGKSSLISRVAKRRLAACRDLGGIAILSIDPTSPVSGGAILGDRIRMDGIANEPDLYIRSVSSRTSSDGLADNVADLIAAVEERGFHEVLLESVGVGQAEYAIHHLVDTLVMVLQPNAGDAVQAMKSGLLELADIFVINKADLPGAKKTAAEMRAIVGRVAKDGQAWRPPVIEVARDEPAGLEALDTSISEHLDWLASHRDPTATRRARQRYHVQSLVVRRIAELLDQQPQRLDETSLPDLYAWLVEALSDDSRRG